MRKIGLFTVTAALIGAGIAGWAATNSQARVATVTGAGVDPLQIMLNGKNLPSEHYEDLSLIFN
ncbi:MAG TPA: hypothetical protein VGF60_22785 [Xanthobacteraceae bacterium]|jgi:hypothetical protein